MHRRTRIIASALAGIAAALLAAWYGSSVRAEADQARQELLAAYGGELVSVCVAVEDIEAGETLDEGNVRLEEWVTTLLPADAETSLEDVLGKKATSSIPAHAVLSPLYLKVPDGDLEIPEGAVAVSVAVDAAHAVGGAAEPGMEVEVYVSANGVADRLCLAEVIDTSIRDARGTADDLSWVTLAVDPERVEELLAAMARASIFLVAPGEDIALEGGEEPVDEAESEAKGAEELAEEEAPADEAATEDETADEVADVAAAAGEPRAAENEVGTVGDEELDNPDSAGTTGGAW